MEEMKDPEAISLQKTSSKMAEISSSLSVFKCKWHKLSNQKIEMGRMDKIKTWSSNMQSRKYSLWIQRH